MPARMRFLLRLGGLVCLAAVPFLFAHRLGAQGWWGPGGRYERPDPGYDDDQPPYSPPGDGGYGQPRYGTQPAAPPPGYAGRDPICRQLEFQLSGGISQNLGGQDQLSRLDLQMRQLDQQYHKAKFDAEQANCYEDMFLFGRSVRQTPRCLDLDRQVQDAKARLAQTSAQREAIARGNAQPPGRRQAIVAELARNHCGDEYTREYQQDRNRNASIFSFFSDEDPTDQGRYTAPSLAASGYKTMCVRLCDGFYYPISWSTTESHFQEDAAKCQSQCASPAELYILPGDADVDQMTSLSGKLYTSLPNAFRNRKVYIRGCSCKASEYSPEEIAKSEEALRHQGAAKRADAGGNGKLAANAAPAAKGDTAKSQAAPAPAVRKPETNPAP